MRIKTEPVPRPIFLMEEVKDESKVAYISYIPATSEIFVQLKDEDGYHLEAQGYFFKNCDSELFNNLKNSANTYEFLKKYIYPNKDYTLEQMFG